MLDIQYMHLAIELARAAIGQTSPNPVVGSVVVRDGQIIGTGSHLYAGGPHAEVHALSVNKDMNTGATLYVTLEPCCHYGRTPPCTDAIIAAQIKRVVIATLDPNPLVNGQGITKLKEAGIEVTVGMCALEAERLNQAYFYYIQHKKPYITLKVGMSLDAKLATHTGDSKWITSREARDDAHSYRYTHDAILVGVNTICADNPRLTTRLENRNKNPIRIILDRNLRTPLHSTVLNDNAAATWIITTAAVAADKLLAYEQLPGVRIIQLEEYNLNNVITKLGELGITSVLVEGGNQIHTSFLQIKLFNQLVLYIAPKLIGGEAAPHFFAGQGFSTLAETLQVKIEAISQVGEDIKIIASNLELK